jgi:lipoprotein-anchoring transpeptidase ErfK/SrfK
MRIEVSISQQTLTVLDGDQILADFIISTATNGEGSQKNSGCTPTGQHIIRAKIGDGAPINSVFVGRRATGEICSPELMTEFPNRDWILTRILWLSGTEVGVNRLGEVDTMQRYIYIHGTPDNVVLGQPGSHGCIRMRNADVIALFNMVPVGTPIHISGGQFA